MDMHALKSQAFFLFLEKQFTFHTGSCRIKMHERPIKWGSRLWQRYLCWIQRRKAAQISMMSTTVLRLIVQKGPIKCTSRLCTVVSEYGWISLDIPRRLQKNLLSCWPCGASGVPRRSRSVAAPAVSSRMEPIKWESKLWLGNMMKYVFKSL